MTNAAATHKNRWGLVVIICLSLSFSLVAGDEAGITIITGPGPASRGRIILIDDNNYCWGWGCMVFGLLRTCLTAEHSNISGAKHGPGPGEAVAGLARSWRGHELTTIRQTRMSAHWRVWNIIKCLMYATSVHKPAPRKPQPYYLADSYSGRVFRVVPVLQQH